MAAKGHSGDSIVAHEELNLDELYQKPKQIDSISDSIGERVALDHYRKFQMEEHGNSVDISKLTHHMLREQRETLAARDLEEDLNENNDHGFKTRRRCNQTENTAVEAIAKSKSIQHAWSSIADNDMSDDELRQAFSDDEAHVQALRYHALWRRAYMEYL
ncbi:hypothetical protein JHW43_004237 [Diplocarpon mali]|nr:hypothetical protein JHW43_004237 [Diplocarpon mali]